MLEPPHRKLEPFPTHRDRVRGDDLGELRFDPRDTHTQFHFSDPREEHRRAIKVVAITGVVGTALLGALVYFAGVIAGAVVLGVLAFLIKLGNSVLDDTIDLH